LVLAPYNVQEMADFVKLGFELAFKYRNPVMILADGTLGQMMEKVELPPQEPRVNVEYPWATTGKPKNGERRVITSLHIQPEKMEEINIRLQQKYQKMKEEEVRYQTKNLEDAEYIFTAFGLVSRIAMKAMDLGRQKGYKIGWIRPITLFPFPEKIFQEVAPRVKGILDIEMNSGQMVEDVKLSVCGKTRVEYYGRMGGVVPTPEEILENFERMFIKGE
ncbi:MAG: 3-methyl-2-oxobutanoate dehydrogenase subunit beta, partial [Candidatus Kapaibacteriota bacterium]